MKKMIKNLVAAIMLVTGVAASAGDDVQIYSTDNSKGNITAISIEKAFENAGFSISGNNNMNVAFKGKFQKTHHKMYHLFASYKADLVLELVKVSPKAALFAPLSMSIYMKKGSNNISIAALTLDGMAKITGISSTNKHMKAYAKLITDTLAKALPNGHFEKSTYKSIKATGNLVTNFTYEMEATEADEIAEEKEGTQMEMEGSLETVGFVIAGFNELGEEFKEVGYDKYDFFDAYSICKLPVIFQVSQMYPEAGALAPCTLYMYKEKGSLDVQMAYPSVHNWISSLAITDKKSVEVLLGAEKTMVDTVNDTIE
ncbi:MAG: hypothetical protein ACI9TV_002403 [Sulfurimonas sp.]|jgi:uncharacterized protein (DUF302 family)|uniref:DUF302 domain-containing protein n=1 Tax=Sulfurimonas sp. TaxID=2022749 RepID=UPI0039E42720